MAQTYNINQNFPSNQSVILGDNGVYLYNNINKQIDCGISPSFNPASNIEPYPLEEAFRRDAGFIQMPRNFYLSKELSKLTDSQEAVLIRILTFANYRDRIVKYRGRDIPCKRGQWLTSRESIVKAWGKKGATIQKVRTILAKLVKMGIISDDSVNGEYRIITVLHYDKYFPLEEETNRVKYEKSTTTNNILIQENNNTWSNYEKFSDDTNEETKPGIGELDKSTSPGVENSLESKQPEQPNNKTAEDIKGNKANCQDQTSSLPLATSGKKGEGDSLLTSPAVPDKGTESNNTALNIELRKEKEKSSGQKERENKPAQQDVSNYPYLFITWWNLYGRKQGRKEAERMYWRLDAETHKKIFEHTAKYIAATPNKQYRKKPGAYLYGECWNDEIIDRNETNNKNKKENGANKRLFRLLN